MKKHKTVKEKIETYLREQFPHRMILEASRKEIDRDIEEIYGTLGVVLSVYPYHKKKVVYYKIERIK